MSGRIRLRWPVDDHAVTQYFGDNRQIYAKFGMAGHEGMDFRAPPGSSIYACAAGEVFDIRPNNGNAYGLHVRVRHRVGDREYRTVYAHLSEVLVSLEQEVAAGQLIALSGNTGHTFGAHLHLTLKLIGARTPGYPPGIVNPLYYLQDADLPEPGDLTLYAIDRVRLRMEPTTSSAQLAWLGEGDALIVLGDPDVAREKVGQYGRWVQVQCADGMDGFVAAWHLQLQPTAGTLPEEISEPDSSDSLVVYAAEALNIRLSPSTESSRIAIALPEEALHVIGDQEAAVARMGDRGAWLRVAPDNPADVSEEDELKGYIAAWYVQTEPGPAVGTLLTAYPTEDMNMRERPTVKAETIGKPEFNAPLIVHDDPQRARALVGRYDEWLYVETAEGRRGWLPSWHVSLTRVEPGG